MLCNSSWSWYTGHWLVDCTRCNSSAIMGSVSIMLLLCIWCLLAGHISVLTEVQSIFWLCLQSEKCLKYTDKPQFSMWIWVRQFPLVSLLHDKCQLITLILSSCSESWWKWCLYIASAMQYPKWQFYAAAWKYGNLRGAFRKFVDWYRRTL